MKLTSYVRKEYVWLVTLTIVLGAYFFLAVPAMLHGPYSTDEGWYLNDALLTWSGYVPYRDFAFPQPPLILVFHGFFQRFFGPGWYLGRFVNMFLGSISVLFVAVIARRIGGLRAGIFAGTLLAFFPWYAVQMVSVNTYGLAILFLLLTTYSILKRWWVWAGFFAVASVWTRLPLIAIFPFLVWAIIFFDRPSWKKNVQSFSTGILLGVIALVLPFCLAAADKMYVNIIGFHAYTRSSLFLNPQAIFDYIRYEYLPLYGWLWVCSLSSLSVFWPYFKVGKEVRVLVLFMMGAVAVIAIAQASATNISYDTILLPWLTICAGYGLSLLMNASNSFRPVVCLLVLLAIVASNLATPLRLYSGQGDNDELMSNIHRAAMYIKAHSASSDVILTPEQYVSLQAGRQAMPGWGIGRFSYFPEFSRLEAQRRGVLNEELLHEQIQSRQARFIVINTAHHWLRGPQTPQAGAELHALIKAAGYKVVEALAVPLPAVEQIRVYERI